MWCAVIKIPPLSLLVVTSTIYISSSKHENNNNNTISHANTGIYYKEAHFLPCKQFGAVKNLRWCGRYWVGPTTRTFPPSPGFYWPYFKVFAGSWRLYRVQIFALTAWPLWNSRNALRLGKFVQPLQMLPSLAGGLLQDFINSQDPVPVPTVISSPTRWCTTEQISTLLFSRTTMLLVWEWLFETVVVKSWEPCQSVSLSPKL